MSENAELWSRVDEISIRRTLKDYLNRHSINYDDNATTEELTQIYIDTECRKKVRWLKC
mgnify:FL=1